MISFQVEHSRHSIHPEHSHAAFAGFFSTICLNPYLSWAALNAWFLSSHEIFLFCFDQLGVFLHFPSFWRGVCVCVRGSIIVFLIIGRGGTICVCNLGKPVMFTTGSFLKFVEGPDSDARFQLKLQERDMKGTFHQFFSPFLRSGTFGCTTEKNLWPSLNSSPWRIDEWAHRKMTKIWVNWSDFKLLLANNQKWLTDFRSL